jgi:hypothetical protein
LDYRIIAQWNVVRFLRNLSIIWRESGTKDVLSKSVEHRFPPTIQMNPKQLEYSIFEAVSDTIARVWTIEEKQLIQNDSELQSHLKEWLSNSLSDTCW